MNESIVPVTTRVRQVSSMFDVPLQIKQRLEYNVQLPTDETDWNIGLIVGPSGSGKTSIVRNVWGIPPKYAWSNAAVIDEFADLSVDDVCAAFSAIGFNTIPAWLRPFNVLSNGEQFRVEMARALLRSNDVDPIIVDEFTSVVDRQVATIACHSIQKFVRNSNRKLVAVGCHYDVIDWLQPDWILDMSTCSFTRRLLQRRPTLPITIARVPKTAWNMFKKFHYMMANLHPGARCFGLWVGETLACFVAVMQLMGYKHVRKNHRTVCLPDYQGLGLAFVLTETLGAAYSAQNYAFRNYPVHPSFVRAHQKSPVWKQLSAASTAEHTFNSMRKGSLCSTFEYVGPSMSKRDAQLLIGVD